MGTAQAASLRIDGTATWSITKPDCVFEVVGAIQNLSPSNTVSGTLKLTLWATYYPFPSQGLNVAETILTPLQGGTQITDFRKKVKADLQGLTGDYYFTVALMEYSGYRWDTRVVVPFGTRKLDNGDFLDETTWRPSATGFVAPPSSIAVGKRLRLHTMANSMFTRITAGTDSDTYITLDADNEARTRYGSERKLSIYNYATGLDTFRGKQYRSGRVSLYRDGVRETHVILFFREANKGIYRMADDGRLTWGTFVIR